MYYIVTQSSLVASLCILYNREKRVKNWSSENLWKWQYNSWWVGIRGLMTHSGAIFSLLDDKWEKHFMLNWRAQWKRLLSDDSAFRIEISPEMVYFALQICHIRKFSFALNKWLKCLINSHIPWQSLFPPTPPPSLCSVDCLWPRKKTTMQILYQFLSHKQFPGYQHKSEVTIRKGDGNKWSGRVGNKWGHLLSIPH